MTNPIKLAYHLVKHLNICSIIFTIILKSQKDTDNNSKSIPQNLQTKIGGINWGNCAKTGEAGLQKLPEITEINVVFATETFGIN
ncbi:MULTISPECIES: hypothetical protein [unclassified Microcoleus]|uniref:hypothetical protein n=1 Tax=unclassified Microcoleus TaxID=2642155 RepID=UPI002FD1D7E8